MSNDTVEVFISYSKQDKELRDRLLAHLRPLETRGIITWHDRQILPGTRWDEEIKARLNAADIILLLISADFLATDYCTQVEIPEALQRHEAGEVTVMPVILRACGWKYTALEAIQAYPEKAKPIKSWSDIDEAFTSVVDEVYLAATEIRKKRKQRRLEEQERQRQEVKKQKQTARGFVLPYLPIKRERRETERLKQALEYKQELEYMLQNGLNQITENKPQQEQTKQQLPNTSKGNYTQLEALLKAEKWKAADGETTSQMCQVMGRQKERGLRYEDIQQFPCADLCLIDGLWVKYSQGKFGISVQKQIWQEYGSPTTYDEQWEKFGKEVGWKKNGLLGIDSDWKSLEEFTSDVTIAPRGHFPFGLYKFGVIGLFARARTCRL